MPNAYEAFLEGVRAEHGEEAEPWLARVDHLIAELCGRWELETGEPRRGDAGGYVVDAIRGRRERVVLRIAFPDGWFSQQVTALSAWDGRGVVELIDHDPRGGQLLERPDPGRPLALVRDDELAMGAAAEVAKKIWVDDPGGIDPVAAEAAAWAASLEDRNEVLGTVVDDDLLAQAREALVIRSGEARERVLLHGNLRLGSILSSRRQPWLAIDPQPLVGEREFDATALLTDGADRLAADVDVGRERVGHRFDLLSSRLNCDRERLKGWAIGITVDDALWWFEAGDRDAGIDRVAVARMLQDLTP
jgi:streptomycin 6-kinase